ncbi:MAG: hypothetical protein IIU86_05430 [Oscillospiraceae bacterium]|nr:hypothetical protein [Oscillospiraceae bacterium]
MGVFLKAVAGILTALILWLSLDKHGKDFSILLTLAVCAMIITVAMSFLQPVVDFINKIQAIGNLDNDLLAVILKVVGIGLIAEISTLICKDAGNESMGKALQILASVVIVWMSIPVFEKLLSLLDNLLGTT